MHRGEFRHAWRPRVEKVTVANERLDLARPSTRTGSTQAGSDRKDRPESDGNKTGDQHRTRQRNHQARGHCSAAAREQDRVGDAWTPVVVVAEQVVDDFVDLTPASVDRREVDKRANAVGHDHQVGYVDRTLATHRFERTSRVPPLRAHAPIPPCSRTDTALSAYEYADVVLKRCLRLDMAGSWKNDGGIGPATLYGPLVCILIAAAACGPGSTDRVAQGQLSASPGAAPTLTQPAAATAPPGATPAPTLSTEPTQTSDTDQAPARSTPSAPRVTTTSAPTAAPRPPSTVPTPLRAPTVGAGPTRVIVTFAIDWQPESDLDDVAVDRQRKRFEDALTATVEALNEHAVTVISSFPATAQAVLEIDQAALGELDEIDEIGAVASNELDPSN